MRKTHKSGLASKKRTSKSQKPRATSTPRSTPSTFRSHYRDIENLSKRR